MLDLRRLVLLRELKLRGSMSAAARELAYSHSAISQQLSLLERESGVSLFEKIGRNVRLTPAGEELVRNTEAILAAVERAESDLASFHGRPRGILRVAAFATISRSIMPLVLASLAKGSPELEVHMQLAHPEVAAVRLTSRQVDVVLTDAYPGTRDVVASGVHVTHLGRDPIRGYLPAPSTETNLDALAKVPWVMEPPAAASTQWALRVCREIGFEPRVVHESADLLFHLRMVESGAAAAFLPDMVVREAASKISPSVWLPTDQHRSIHFLVREGSEERPAVVALREAIQEAFDRTHK